MSNHIVCEMQKNGCHIKDKDYHVELFLVVSPDKDYSVYCSTCIHENTWDIGTLFYRIGDDVTNWFL